MAVFNTAFGSLPQYKDITGMDDQKRRRQPTVEEQQPRDFGQQYRAQQQAQQAKPAAPAQTFAQMQAAGQARPAPPMSQAAAPAPPMLARLQDQLGAPTPAPAAAQAPAAAAPPMGAAAEAPPAATTFTDRSGTVWNRTGNTWTPSTQFGAGGFGRRTRTAGAVETDPATGLPRLNIDQQVINAYLPEEVFQAPDGNVWVKRRNNWVLEEGNEQLRGYAALRPTGLPKDAGTGGGDISNFLFNYGRPSNDAEMATLAANFGMTPAQVQTIIARTPYLYPSQAEATARRTGVAAESDVGVSGGGRVAGVTLPPDEQTTPPEYQGPAEQWKSGGDAPLTGNVDPRMGARDQRATVDIPRESTRLDAEGLPGEFRVGQGTLDIQENLRNILRRLEEAPSPYDSEAYKAAEAAARADLEAQYGASRMSLEEQLARQGLSASTFGAGRYGDLAGQQARALATMRSDLLREAANQQAERTDVLLRSMAGLSEQMSDQDIAEFRANLDRYSTRGTLENQLKEILQRGDISKTQASATLLSALLPMIDTSTLTSEQWAALLKQFGIDLSGIKFGKKDEKEDEKEDEIIDANALKVSVPPTDLSPYPEGQRFDINGVLVEKRNNRLVYVSDGRPYNPNE